MVEMEAEQDSVSYYRILGVGSESSIDEIKRAYRKLAMQWHPDRWTKCPSLLGEAKRKFQQIQEAYSVLSDQSKRTLYDVGLFDSEAEEDEGLSDFVKELMSLMAQDKREDKNYTVEELQAMFMEMVQEFEPCSWYSGSSSSILEEAGPSKRARCDSNLMLNACSSHFSASGWRMYGSSSYCN